MNGILIDLDIQTSNCICQTQRKKIQSSKIASIVITVWDDPACWKEYDCWKKRYQLSSKSSWPWLVPWRPCQNTPLKIPPPAASVEGVSLRWFILSCEYCISTSEIRAHTCYQSRRKKESQKMPDTRECLGNLEISLSNIEISFT